MWWHRTSTGALTLQLQSFLHITKQTGGGGRARTRRHVSHSPPALLLVQLTRVVSSHQNAFINHQHPPSNICNHR